MEWLKLMKQSMICLKKYRKTVSISEYANDERIQKLMDAGYLCDEEKQFYSIL